MEYTKRNYKEKLDGILKISNTLLRLVDNGTDDVDDECYEIFKESYDNLNSCLDIVLKNQKKRGKEFLSNDDIDNIVNNAISESKMKHLKRFNESNSNNYLSNSEIEYLKSVGFIQDDKKNSGYYYKCDDSKTKVLIPKENGFKMEYYEMCDDGDGGFYEDYDKEYSKPGQTLEEFINEN